jgi:uncharacterized RmlC-like cupin family protein
VIGIVAIVTQLWPGDAHAVRPGTQSEGIFENERVIVLTYPSGPARRPLGDGKRLPGVIVTLANGDVRMVEDAGSVATEFADAGSGDRGSPRVVIIALKEHRPPTLETPPGMASAFPRDGTKQIVENDRVAIWDVRWTTGLKTALHFHDKDVVAVYLDAGTVRSIPVGGQATATPRAAGDVVFIPRGRAHVEECIEGPRRDIIIELK